MRILKYGSIIILSFVVLAAGAVYFAFAHYKRELTAAVIDHVNARFNVDLSCEKVTISMFSEWPRGALRLRNVSASGKEFPGSFFRAGTISVSFNLRDLIHKRFTVHSLDVRDGDIRFIKLADTTANGPGSPREPDSTEADFSFAINKIHLRNVRFVYESPGPGQLFDLVFTDDVIRIKNFTDGIEARVKGKMFSNGMTFRANRGEFFDSCAIRLNLSLNYFNAEKSLCIRPGSGAEINGQTYDLTGVLDFGSEKTIGLIADTRQVSLEQVRRFVNPRIRRTLDNYEASRPFNARAILFASMGKKQEPALLITANTRNNTIKIGTSRIPYTEVGFNAKIVCVDHTGKKGDIETATITFKRLFGKVYDFPFSALVRVTNLRRPYLTVSAKMNIDAANIGFSLKNEFELKGRAHAHIKYAGLADRINKKEFLSNRMKLTAELQLLNLQYREKKRPYVYTLNGSAQVVNTNVVFSGLRLSSVAGDAVLEGKVDNFVDYVLGYTNGFTARLTAHSDSLNLNPVLMQNKGGSPVAGEHKKKDSVQILAAAAIKDSLRTESIQVQKETLSRFEFDVKLNAKKLVMRRVHAEDAKIDLRYADEILDIRSLRLYTCGGKLTASGVIEKFAKLNADISVEDVDVNTMFTQFENFGQEAIVSENLKGKIHVQAKFKSQLDDQLEVIGETMSGEVRLSLKDGQLVNFEPVQKLSNFLFRNRDFNNVTFSELNESFQVRGYEMTINELEIGSNILNLYVVNGIYNFKGLSNINLLVPWSNLKRRGKDHVPSTSGERAEHAKGVKLNFHGPSNKMKLSLGHKELTALKPSI